MQLPFVTQLKSKDPAPHPVLRGRIVTALSAAVAPYVSWDLRDQLADVIQRPVATALDIGIAIHSAVPRLGIWSRKL
jgi:hypothetical protein